MPALVSYTEIWQREIKRCKDFPDLFFNEGDRINSIENSKEYSRNQFLKKLE